MSHRIMGRRMLPVLLLVLGLLTAGASSASAAVLDLENLSASQLHDKLSTGEITSEQLTRAYIRRIEALNLQGPTLNAVRVISPYAVAEAKASDARRAAGQARGPMDGIPVLVKDNIDVAGLPTTAGSVALEHSVPDKDSPLVTNLRRAGAVLLGKTNLSEYANYIGLYLPSGGSSLGGQVLNANDTDPTPSGSSSGSGAAAAAALAAVTIGTETSGSIISPSAAEGLVGLRPTVGLVSRTGVVPISGSQDTAGPMVRTVKDAAMELQAIAGKDPDDPATDGQPATVPDYLAALPADPRAATALAGMKIGVLSTAPAGVAAVLQALGATTTSVTTPSNTSQPGILSYEFRRDMDHYLDRLPDSAPRQEMQDIIDYNNSDPVEAFRYGQQFFLQATSSTFDITSNPAAKSNYEGYRDNGRTDVRNNINAALSLTDSDPSNDLDALVGASGTLTGVGARAGYPQLTVNNGYDTVLRRPANISFNGTAYSEATLLKIAYAFEQKTLLRKPVSQISPSMYRCAKTEQTTPYDSTSCNPGSEILKDLGDVPALSFSLETTSATSLAKRLANKTVSSTTLTKEYLKRIGQANAAGPGLQAVRQLNPNALAEAAASDARRDGGTSKGPLDGLPVIVTSNLDVSGLATPAGSMALEDNVAAGDSAVVAKLRAAGAVILGTANITELNGYLATVSTSTGSSSSGGMPSGYSALGGQVLNAYDTDLVNLGSSAGAASAASAGLAALAVGTETQGVNGSIVEPAASAGVVGFKPTFGVVGRTGMLPLARSQDTIGPLGRTVADVATTLGVIAGHDAGDPDSSSAAVPDYAGGLQTTALNGKRIGYYSGVTDAIYNKAVAAMTAAGATMVALSSTPTPSSQPSVLPYEFKRDLNAYLGGTPSPKTLGDVLAFNTAHADEELKYGQDLAAAANAVDLSDATTNTAYTTAKSTGQTESRSQIDDVLTTNTLAAIVVPSATSVTQYGPTSASITAASPTYNNSTYGAAMTAIADRAGYPILTVPAGYNDERRHPENISFVGTAGSDAALLNVGYGYEQGTQLRQAPSYVDPSQWRCGVDGSAFPPRSCFTIPAQTADVLVPTPPPDSGSGAGSGNAGGATPQTPVLVAAPGKAKLTVAKAPVKVARNRTFKVKIMCTAPAGGTCRASLLVINGRRVLATRSVTVKAGRLTSVTLRLTASDYRTLERRHSLKPTIRLTARTASGTLEQAVVRVTLKV